MLKYAIVLCAVVVVLPSAQNVDSLIDHANELYETRHLEGANLDESAAILEGILESDPENVRALFELSKVCYQLGDRAEDKGDKIDYYDKGRDLGSEAAELDDESPDAHFWYMVNVGRIGQTKGVLNSLFLVPTVKSEISKVLELDPQHTGALNAQAMLYYELPGYRSWPTRTSTRTAPGGWTRSRSTTCRKSCSRTISLWTSRSGRPGSTTSTSGT